MPGEIMDAPYFAPSATPSVTLTCSSYCARGCGCREFGTCDLREQARTSHPVVQPIHVKHPPAMRLHLRAGSPSYTLHACADAG
jgi:hypothetical protein